VSLAALQRWALNKPLLAGAGAIAELPNDPALPALLAIRALGLAAAIPALALEGFSAEFALRGYTAGSRATLEVRAEERRFAIKAYAEDPAPEAELYGVLAAAGLNGDAPVRVPPLLAWNRELRVLAIGWLEGPTAKELIERGQGRRAGELAAHWVQRAVSLPVKFGRPLEAAHIMHKARNWAATVVAADPALGNHAVALVEMLALTQPKEDAPRLLHGTLYSRHVLDLGDGAGLIDWDRFGQGPIELDAGIFLASTWQLGVRRGFLASEVAQLEASFLAGTAGFLDERALAWHRAAMLLRLANKIKHRPSDGWLARAAALLAEAARLADAAG
jgi:aminoglycoside phosphotransferase (APT) family kinase protein